MPEDKKKMVKGPPYLMPKYGKIKKVLKKKKGDNYAGKEKKYME